MMAATGDEGAQPAASDIAARLDALPVTPLHRIVLVVCALGLLFDVIEAGLGNALSAVFSAPPYRVAPFRSRCCWPRSSPAA